MFNATIFKGQVLYENEYGFLEYSPENEQLSKTSNAFKAVLKQNPVHKRFCVVKSNYEHYMDQNKCE